MSAAADKVDVLAVLDVEISYAEDALAKRETVGAHLRLGELRKARAAVAELIEKANAVSGEPGGEPCDCLDGDKHGDCGHCELRAALARVGGAE